MKLEDINIFDDHFGAPYEEHQEVKESFGSFLDFAERCAKVYGGDEVEGFDTILEKVQRPHKFGENQIGELF